MLQLSVPKRVMWVPSHIDQKVEHLADAGEDDLPSPGYMSSAPKGLGQHQAGQKSRVSQGGFYQDLHTMLDVSSGGEVRSE